MAAAGATVVFRIEGSARARRMLRQWQEPELSRRAQTATTVGVEVVRRPLQKEAAAVSSRMSKSVYVRKARRDLPATVAGYRPKVAWFRHFVIGGTRAHGPRRKQALRFRGRFGWVIVKRVRGVKPNPIIVRVARQYQRKVFDAMIRSLTRQAAGGRR